MDEVLGDRYVLGPELGEGGMARVYRGTMRGADSPVAVKILRGELAEDHPELSEVFLRNRRVLTSISHTNLVKVLDVVQDGDTIGIVMELVDGDSLRAFLTRARKLRPDAALPVFKQIMLGLAELHARGITHGDVKPDNVLLDDSAGDLVAKITDFGLADVQRVTLPEGFIFGTPAYIAPEVASGGVVGPAADVYSAGIVLYEMLAGYVPFTGTNAVLFYKHQNEDPPPIPGLASDRDTTWSLLGRLLAKDPDKRPSAFSILAELDQTPLGIPPSADVGLHAGDLAPPSWARTTSMPIRIPPSVRIRPRSLASVETSVDLAEEAEEPAPVTRPTRLVRTRLARRLVSLRPRRELREETVDHAEGSLYRFDAGFDEFLLVDRLDGKGTLNWTTAISATDFVGLVGEYLDDGDQDDTRLTVAVGGITDEMGAGIGVALARLGGDAFDRDCQFIRFDRQDLTLAYQVLAPNERTAVFGISAPRLATEQVLPLLIKTGTDELVAHALGAGAGALPARLVTSIATLDSEG